MMTPFVIVAVLAAIGALIFGISAMASGGEVAHYNSVEWMIWRVGMQAVAFLLILLAIIGLN
jgi:hypothetical protein